MSTLIIGAGIVGLSTALALKKCFPDAKITVLEKEPIVGAHQSGHNSGVLHSGIYYSPSSLKAKLCLKGRQQMLGFCDKEGIAYQKVGKLIVATREDELAYLSKLHKQALENGVECAQVSSERIREFEPFATGISAIHLPHVYVLDYAAVCRRMAANLIQQGVDIKCDTKVQKVREFDSEIVVETNQGAFSAGRLINCAGLYSDRLARLCGLPAHVKIVPFRGEYYRLKDRVNNYCRSMIYPVPDQRFPFLGVHLTRRVSGEVECGPNAVLAFAKEGYRRRDFSLSEMSGVIGFPGFLKMARCNWKYGCMEMHRSLSKKAFLSSLQRLVPSLTQDDIEPGGSGVRAQAVSRDGTLVQDFFIERTNRSVHVLNAPSPAATASLAIGEYVVQNYVV